MATVNVSNFDEFLAAVAVSGDTVNCPEGAVWDMNDIYPEGYNGNIPVNCAMIAGNETEIKNLHLFGQFIATNDLTIDSLHIKNIIGEDEAIFNYGSGGSEREITMRGCVTTGMLGVDTDYFVKGLMNAYSCTLNFDMTNGGRGYQIGIAGGMKAKYSRISAQFPTMAGSALSFGGKNALQFCRLDINFLGCTYINSYQFSGCVVLGNYGSAYDRNVGQHGKFISVFDVAAMADGFEPANEYFKGVTNAQLNDAAYLASIGFPIGV